MMTVGIETETEIKTEQPPQTCPSCLRSLKQICLSTHSQVCHFVHHSLEEIFLGSFSHKLGALGSSGGGVGRFGEVQLMAIQVGCQLPSLSNQTEMYEKQ